MREQKEEEIEKEKYEVLANINAVYSLFAGSI